MARKISYQQAINEALAQEMRRDQSVFIIRQHVSGGTGPRTGAGQPDKQRSPWIVLQIADHPVGAFPPPGGKIMAADAFGILREISQQIFCFQ